MPQITIDISDELASRLEPLHEKLPQLLNQLPERVDRSELLDVQSSLPQAYIEVLDFLVQSPTPAEIISFKISPQCQKRLENLLEKNREGILTTEEMAELDIYQQLEDLMILLKARACDRME